MTVAWLTINLFESYPYHKFAVMLEVELLQLVSGSCGLLQWVVGWQQQWNHKLLVLNAAVAA